MRTIFRTRYVAAAIGASAIAAAGCGTIKTTFYDYEEDGNRNTRRLRGIPMTMEVPIFLRLEVTEMHYYVANHQEPVTVVGRELKHSFISSKEFYAVDFKRPAAGIGEVKLEYGEGENRQYFSKVEQNITDNTISQVAALVQAATSLLPKHSAAKPASNSGQLIEIPHTVAWQVFDLRTPGIEGRVQEFLNTYVNCTQPCSTPKCSPASAFAVPATRAATVSTGMPSFTR